MGSTSTTTAVMTVPRAVQTGDLLLASYAYWASATATAPSGWRLLTGAAAPVSATERVWYRFATTSDTAGATYTWTFGGKK
ncbi:MAG TPA: hypothetical protein VMT64_10190, partial [Candidatus Binataceae bacterium]|nr:hypothetical protein [Candidatus Binataceae bacterium]